MNVAEVVAAVPDPELPFLTIADLGILRSVTAEGGTVRVQITPTYSGCPALETIAADITAALPSYDVVVETVLSPAWTTDWISDRGRKALESNGIAPPGRGPVPIVLQRRSPDPVSLHRLRCVHCGSTATEELSRFGSTACKSLWRCLACREPFEQFKQY